LIGPSLQKKKKTMETPQNRRLYFELYSSSLLVHLYRLKEDTIFQGILWDKSEEVWKKCWGKYWEAIGNLKGT
jgi:hypothetical protein